MDIIKYYLLCSVRVGEKRHVVGDFSNADRNSLFSQKEFELFFREVDDRIIARESIIGGEDSLAGIIERPGAFDVSSAKTHGCIRSIIADDSQLVSDQFANNRALFY